jgi:hypothetical protein
MNIEPAHALNKLTVGKFEMWLEFGINGIILEGHRVWQGNIYKNNNKKKT